MRFVLGFICCYLLTPYLKAQPSVSGIINQYASVLEVIHPRNTIRVDTPSYFSAGQQILLIQMAGATVNTSNTVSYGNITAMNGAGVYQLNHICKVNGDSLVLERTIGSSFDILGKLQCIPVPNFEQVIVSDTLYPRAWDGNKGGVVVISAQKLILQKPIVASGRGFRGGLTEISNFSCNFTTINGDFFYDATSNRAGRKGEGIYLWPNAEAKGKGKAANGGGGGNDHNSGGGGGGLVVSGGDGGRNNEPGFFNCRSDHPGIGGVSLGYSDSTLFMGGGGGAGHTNNTNAASGGNGGGIIILLSDTIQTNNHEIRSNGLSAGSILGDGAGAGGAGGSILIKSLVLIDTLKLRAIGGNGGNTNNNNGNRCYGPGGGGAGGQLYLSLSNAANISLVNNGGSAGLITNSTNACNNTNGGAQNGQNGQQHFLHQPNQPSQPFVFIQLPADTLLCPGLHPFEVNYPSLFDSYTWNDQNLSASRTFDTGGLYILNVQTGLCSFTDSFHLNLDSFPNLDLGPNQQLCNLQPITLDAGAHGPYLWSTGDTTASISYSGSGWVSLQAGLACISTDSVLIERNLLTLNLGADTLLCPGDTLFINSPNTFDQYLWSNTSRAAQTFFIAPALVWLQGRVGNCETRDSLQLAAHPRPQVQLGPNLILCNNETTVLNTNLLGQPHLWSTGAITSSINVSLPGSYWVQVGNTCPGYDTIEVQQITLQLQLPNDTAICQNDSLLVNPSMSPGAILLWNDGSTQTQRFFNSPGMYKATASLSVCNSSDSFSLSIKPLPLFSLGNDTTLCQGESITISINTPHDGVLWDDQSTASNRTLTTEGLYYAQTSLNGCLASDSIQLYVRNLPSFVLPADTAICQRPFVILNGPSGMDAYLWSNGITTQEVIIESPGVYWLRVQDSLCFSERVFTEATECPSEEVFVPNAFTPNGDGLNQQFVLDWPGNTPGKLQIYNRWGQLLFSTDKPWEEFWDGRFQNEVVPDGVYLWQIFIRGREAKQQKGTVLIMR